MILKKPYAFFIKHFKLLNVLLTALEVYAIYKLSFLVHYFFEYSSYPQGSVGQNLVEELLPTIIYIIHIIIAIFTFIMILVLSTKKKPRKLYYFILISNIFTMIVLMISKHFLGIMQLQIIENRTAFAVRDFLTIAIITQFFIAILTGMRSLGFDIKKFQFGQDLQKLDISEEDSEEFIVQIDVDSNELKRSINKNKRYLKYFIQENKMHIVLFLVLSIAGVVAFFYFNSGIYFGTKKVNEMVTLDNFNFSVGDTYLTTKDSNGQEFIKDNVIAIIPIKIKTISEKEKLETARFALVLGDKRFYHDITYKDKISDFGTIYNSQVIAPNEFTNYLLAFTVPKGLASKNAYLEYYSTDEKTAKFKVNKINVDLDTETSEKSIGEELKLNDVIVKNGTLIIDEIDIKEKFKLNFSFKIYDYEFDSYEYVTPNYFNNYDKTLLKIKGRLTSDENVDLYTLIDNYGRLIYSLNGETKTQNIEFKRVEPQKTKQDGIYYIEILKEIENAEHISFVFKVRGKTYIYKLK